jgi:hypothetical protein
MDRWGAGGLCTEGMDLMLAPRLQDGNVISRGHMVHSHVRKAPSASKTLLLYIFVTRC